MLLSSKRIALKALGRDEEGRGSEEYWMGFQNTPSSKLPVHLWLNISTPASELIFNDFVWVVTLRKLHFWKVSGRIAQRRWHFQIWHFTLSVCEGIVNHTHQQKLREYRGLCVWETYSHTYPPIRSPLPRRLLWGPVSWNPWEGTRLAVAFPGHKFINCHAKLVLLVTFLSHRILRQLRKGITTVQKCHCAVC